MKTRHTPTTSLPSELGDRSPGTHSDASVRSGKGTKAEICTLINRPANELFAFWRNFENLPRVMDHIESVKCLSSTRSHWKARAAGDDSLEWDAEVINEHPNELIAWRTLEGSDVRQAGTIRFVPASPASATEVHLTVEYEAPGNAFSQVLAKIIGRSPEQRIRRDLQHFKELMEAG